MRILSLILSVIISTFSFLPCFNDDMKIDAIQKELPGDAYSFNDEGGVSVHDPSLFKAKDGTYYAYGTHITTAKSSDLINWETVSSGVYDSNRLLVPEGKTLRQALSEPFSWCDAAQVQWGTPENEWQTNVWAPSVIYNKTMKKYCYYGSTSLFGTANSVIWMATSENPEGPFIYEDCVLYSGFNKHITADGDIMYPTHYKYTNLGELSQTLVYTKKQIESQSWFHWWDGYDNSYGKAPNCIDPAVFYDKKGNLWMTYGSYSGGTYIVPLCKSTGMPDFFRMKRTKGYDMYFGKKLLSTNEETEGSGEGPFILYDKQTDYYYLFVTYGFLDAAGGYNIRQYRSKNPDGPYVDIMGNDGTEMKSTGLKISGNYGFEGEGAAYLSSGHSSYLTDGSKIFEAFHTRYNDDYGGYFNMKIHQMVRTESGWLTPLPLPYKGETVNKLGFDPSLLYGEWQLVDLGSETVKAETKDGAIDFDSSLSPTQKVTFTENGIIEGFTDYKSSSFNATENCENVNGSFVYERGSEFLTITLGNVEYEGVICEMQGENGNRYIALSAVGSDNSTLLGLKEIHTK